MMLSNQTILSLIRSNKLQITPFDPIYVQPASYDVTLSPLVNDNNNLITYTSHVKLPPHTLVIAQTREQVRLPEDIAAELSGRSSIGRMGIAVHITAGHIDPGFCGNITFEMINFRPYDQFLPINSPIAQLTFFLLDQPANPTYNGRYQYQDTPTESRL